MKIVTNLNSFKKKRSQKLILAIGNFDGFHRGHQKLLAYVVAQAKKHHALAAVLTFRQHPQSVLHPEKKQLLLYSLEQKLFYLAQAGIDICFLQSFTPSFSQMPPQDFVEKILVKKLHVLEVCMGYDAHFGHSRKGTTHIMRTLARQNGFLFKRMSPVVTGGTPVSSSLIRKYLSAGKVEKAAVCLGRPFSLFGKVIKGKGHGAHLGFPTANLEVHSNILIPFGVYVAFARMLPASIVRHCERSEAISSYRLPRSLCSLAMTSIWFPGAVNFGKRPTYPASETPRPVLEMHLFDFDEDIYSEGMEVALHKFVRPEKRFKNERDLKAQILHDTEVAKEYHLDGGCGSSGCVTRV